MNKKDNIEENNLKILRKLSDSNKLTQRKLAEELGFSLGKLNYCLNELKKKGLLSLATLKIIKIKLTMFIF